MTSEPSVDGPYPSEEDLETDLPPLSDEPDNEPDDSAEYIQVETQDREGTDRPAVDKHPEEE